MFGTLVGLTVVLIVVVVPIAAVGVIMWSKEAE